jgi:hypothetical protein
MNKPTNSLMPTIKLRLIVDSEDFTLKTVMPPLPGDTSLRISKTANLCPYTLTPVSYDSIVNKIIRELYINKYPDFSESLLDVEITNLSYSYQEDSPRWSMWICAAKNIQRKTIEIIFSDGKRPPNLIAGVVDPKVFPETSFFTSEYLNCLICNALLDQAGW